MPFIILQVILYWLVEQQIRVGFIESPLSLDGYMSDDDHHHHNGSMVTDMCTKKQCPCWQEEEKKEDSKVK